MFAMASGNPSHFLEAPTHIFQMQLRLQCDFLKWYLTIVSNWFCLLIHTQWSCHVTHVPGVTNDCIRKRLSTALFCQRCLQTPPEGFFFLFPPSNFPLHVSIIRIFQHRNFPLCCLRFNEDAPTESSGCIFGDPSSIMPTPERPPRSN